MNPVSGLLVFLAWLLKVSIVPDNSSTIDNYLLPWLYFGRLVQSTGGAAPAVLEAGHIWLFLENFGCNYSSCPWEGPSPCLEEGLAPVVGGKVPL